MAISIKRLGSDRDPDEGLRLGTVRRPPRGVRKEDFATQNYYDVWFPNLAPSKELLKASLPIEDDDGWRRFARAFNAEMKHTGPAKDLDLLAALSHQTNFSLGCYCEHERFCHRSLLRALLLARGAAIR